MEEQNLTSFIYGRQPVMESIQSNAKIEKIFLMAGSQGSFEKDLRQAIVGKHIEIAYVPREKLGRMTKANHQGVIALINNYKYFTADELLNIAKKSGQPALFYMLDQVTDVRNFGAIARSALLGGSHGIFIPTSHSVGVNEDALKASAGALSKLPVCKVASLSDAVDHLAENGIAIYASEMKADVSLPDLALEESCCIVLGSEKAGVSKAVLSRADVVFSIPQTDQLDSYNVSVSAGIIAYQTLLKRKNY